MSEAEFTTLAIYLPLSFFLSNLNRSKPRARAWKKCVYIYENLIQLEFNAFKMYLKYFFEMIVLESEIKVHLTTSNLAPKRGYMPTRIPNWLLGRISSIWG